MPNLCFGSPSLHLKILKKAEKKIEILLTDGRAAPSKEKPSSSARTQQQQQQPPQRALPTFRRKIHFLS
ncbi:hypothetical protein V9T40_011854 [Parthenolecanium corni]|uniref:Uncharacterized protein n=1 Tax=Parthenolecanium corni TaxID=536013 RepID=A0AAN9XZX6_9HEMI